MALPPELIRIKRRRGEEPVDSLFIHTENQQKRRRTTHYNYLFERVTDEDGATEASPKSPEKHGLTAQSPRRTVSSYARSEVPAVRATLPGEELLSGRQRVGTSPKNKKLGDSNGAAVRVTDALEGEGGAAAAPFQTGASSSTKPRDLSMITRRFHLKKTASTFPASRAPGSGIQKRKKGQRADIAVFVEKAREPKNHDGHSGADSHAALKVRSDGVPVVQLNHARPRKRPGTGTRTVVAKKGAERGGRRDLPANSVASSAPPPDPSDAEPDPDPESRDGASLQLAEDLQRATLQPSTLQQTLDAATRLHFRPSSHPRVKPRAPARTLKDLLNSTDSNLPPAAPPPHAKTKLLPVDFTNPYPYGPETQPSKGAAAVDPGVDPGADNDNDNDDDNEDEDEKEDDYVYDTYIRRPTDPSASVDRRKVGVIVITQEDETLWETYGVDEGEDEDWDSAEEDENAEDFHANDYPDEDLASDDEFGRAAYGYRRDASDADEYDERTGSWSDEGAHPWDRRNPWALRVREVEDSDEDELSD